jgi:putative ABC transport system permease protein
VLKLALRNMLRHRSRTALTLAVIISGTAAIILTGGFVEDVFVQLREATIHSQLGHIQVYRTGYRERGAATPFKYLIDKPAEVLQRAREVPSFETAMARLNFTGMIDNGRTNLAILGEGVEPDKESKLGTSITIVAGRPMTDNDRFGMLLGEGIAHAARLKPGDRATLLVNTVDGALNSVDFDVVGVFRSFSREYDARAVRIALPAAQELLAASGVNAIVVSLADTGSTDAAADYLKKHLDPARYEVRTWRELADFYDKTVALYQRQFAVLQGIILVAVLLSVANSVNMSVFERTGEFGTLMALGNRGSNVFRLVISENLLLGLTGGAAGALAGGLLAMIISSIGIPMPPPPNSDIGYTAVIRVTPADMGMGFLIALAATLLGALLPARRIARIPVVDALRQN